MVSASFGKECSALEFIFLLLVLWRFHLSLCISSQEDTRHVGLGPGYRKLDFIYKDPVAKWWTCIWDTVQASMASPTLLPRLLLSPVTSSSAFLAFPGPWAPWARALRTPGHQTALCSASAEKVWALGELSIKSPQDACGPSWTPSHGQRPSCLGQAHTGPSVELSMPAAVELLLVILEPSEALFPMVDLSKQEGPFWSGKPTRI